MGKGLIFDIKRYAINDGPGIRIVIFFKGCNLHCAWCHNPEGLSPEVEKMYTPSKCIGCGICVEACPSHALTLTPSGVVTNQGLCTLCGLCSEICPTKAIEMSGKEMTLEEIMQVIEKERVFFDQSDGGVTFSGGEPLLHTQMLIPLLKECRKRNIHTAIDTAGNVSTSTIMEVAHLTDLFLYDLKLMDSEQHRQWIRAGNRQILHNLRAICEVGANVIVRIPFIAGVNDSPQNLGDTAEFISKLPNQPTLVNLLPYHNIAQHKYSKLGNKNGYTALQTPDRVAQERAIEIFADYGLNASIGG